MRVEDGHYMWAVKPVVKQSSKVWQQHLRKVGLKGAKVFPIPADATEPTEVIEIRIQPGKKVQLTHERIRGIEAKLRGNVGQILQN